MKKAFKDFIRELLFDKSGIRISKTKAAMWLGVVFYVLKLYEVIDAQMFQVLIATAGGVLGVGIRDLSKK